MLWDIFSYFKIKVEFRSPLGRNRDGMWVPSLLRSSPMAQSASPALGLPDPGKRMCFAQPNEQQINWNLESHSPWQPNAPEGNLSSQAQQDVRSAAHGVTQRLGSQGNVGAPLGEIPLPAEHGLPRCSLQTPTARLKGDGRSSFAQGPASLCLSSRHPHPPVHLRVLQLFPALQIIVSSLSFQSSCSCSLSPSFWGCYLGVFFRASRRRLL